MQQCLQISILNSDFIPRGLSNSLGNPKLTRKSTAGMDHDNHYTDN